MNSPEVGSPLGDLVSVNANGIKGLLILIVLADHNNWYRSLAPQLFAPLTFHVLGFFLLAFSFGGKSWGARFVLDRVARYLVPYWWVLTVACSAYFVVLGSKGQASDAIVNWLLAAVLGNAPQVKKASGFLMLWFLPSLFGLSCLIAMLDSTSVRKYSIFWMIAAMVAHLILPLLSKSALLMIPAGLALAAAIFVLGLVWRQLLPRRLPCGWGWASLAVLLFSYGALVALGVHLEIATLELAGIDRPALMVLQDLAGLAGVLVVVWLANEFRNARWLAFIGRHSLLTYLCHPVFYVIFSRLGWGPESGNHSPIALLLLGSLSAFAALSCALTVSVMVNRSRIASAWILPRSWNVWPPVRANS